VKGRGQKSYAVSRLGELYDFVCISVVALSPCISGLY
jgi:hypothetical protein